MWCIMVLMVIECVEMFGVDEEMGRAASGDAAAVRAETRVVACDEVLNVLC